MSDDTAWGKVIIGPFIGAGLAFLSNGFFMRLKRIGEEKAAGNLALLTIQAQYEDYVNYRYGIVQALAVTDAGLGGVAPEWMYAKPISFTFNESNTINFKSLAFLLGEKKGREAFARLQFVERTFLDLAGRHKDYQESASEIQSAAAKIISSVANLDDEGLEQMLGKEITARMRDQQHAIVLRLELDDQRYIQAYNVLSDAMAEKFCGYERLPQLVLREKYRKENLPAWPTVFKTYLDGLPPQDDVEIELAPA